MFKLLLSPTFIKLYLAIFSAFFTVVLSLVLIFAYTESDTEISDFVHDTQALAKQLSQSQMQDPKRWKMLSEHIAPFFRLNAQLIEPNEKSSYLSQLNYLDNYNGIAIYSSPNSERLHAAYPLEHNQLLLISDLPDTTELSQDDPIYQHLINEEIKADNFALITITLAGVFLAAVAFIILYALMKLSHYLHSLSKAGQQFAKGELKTRVDKTMPHPLDHLALNFNHMAEQIESHIHEQIVMSNAISHELRSPLTKLRLALAIAQKTQAHDELKALLESMEEYTDELDQLSDGVLTLARLNFADHNPLELQALELNNLIQQRIAHIQSKAEYAELRISFSCAKSLTLEADAFFLKLALDNLLANACKYCRSTIAVSALSNAQGQVIITVEDDGCGIPEAELESIFTPFARVDKSRDRLTGGYGLGLAIVASICKRHNGNVSAQASELGGAKLIICLPGSSS